MRSGVWSGQSWNEEDDRRDVVLSLYWLTHRAAFPNVIGVSHPHNDGLLQVVSGRCDVGIVDVRLGPRRYLLTGEEQENILRGSWEEGAMTGSVVLMFQSATTAEEEEFSAFFCGEASPSPEFADAVSMNPIAWAITRVGSSLFGCGFFDDAADIPGQPVLFFILRGEVALGGVVELEKQYEAPLDVRVTYIGTTTPTEEGLVLSGRWTNCESGVTGLFRCMATDTRAHPSIALCNQCHTLVLPGTKRVFCSDQVSFCNGCARGRVGKELWIDPGPRIVRAASCADIVRQALHVYSRRDFVGVGGGVMQTYADVASKVWARFVLLGQSRGRSAILLADSASVEWVAWVCALIMKGVVVIPLGANTDVNMVACIVDQMAPDIFISSDERATHPLHLDCKQGVVVEDIVWGEDVRSDNDHVAVLFTSGTTGRPKGVAFTEALCMPSADGASFTPYVRADVQTNDPTAVITLLALMHTGGSLLWMRPENMFDDLSAASPTHLALPVACWTSMMRLYDADCKSGLYTPEESKARARARIGERVVHASCGGAPVSSETQSFAQRVLGIKLAVVYASRETGGICVNERVNAGVIVRVRHEEGGEISNNGRGEVLVWTPRMALYIDPTQGDGRMIQFEGRTFFATGDVGELETDTTGRQSLRIIDRVGTFVKDASGVWVSPSLTETALETHFAQAFVFLESGGIVCAVVVSPLSFDEAHAQAALCCSRAGLPVPGRVYCEADAWTVLNGYLTDSLKKNRPRLLSRYRGTCSEWPNTTSASTIDFRLLEALRRALPGLSVGEKVADLSFAELGASSADAAVVVALLREKGVRVSHVDLYRAKSIRQLSHALQSGFAFGKESLDYWRAQFASRPNANPLKEFLQPSRKRGCCVLVGATGFLGGELVKSLMRRFDCVIAIARRPTAVEVEASRQLVVIQGDVTQPLVGLSLLQWEQISAMGVLALVCNAASVNYFVPFENLRATNVDGPIECARIACALGATFWFISSISASQAAGRITPEQLVESNASGYAQSKAVCEALLHRVKHVSWGILRPGAIGSHSVTGAFNPTDLHVIMAQRSVEVGCFPKLECAVKSLALQWVAVDICAEALAEAIEAGPGIGEFPRVVEVRGTQGPYAHDLFGELHQRFSTRALLEWVSQDEWKERLLKRWSDPVSEWIRSVQLQRASPSSLNSEEQPFDFTNPMLEKFVHCLSTPASIPATMNLNELLKRLRVWDPTIDSRILNVYQLGSRVYGTNHATSDWDFMIVVTKSRDVSANGFFLWECFDDGQVNAGVYNATTFEHMLAAQRLEAIECACLPPQFVWLERVPMRYVADLPVLAKMARWVSRQRLHMAEQRIGNEPYKARKCVFHAFRYLAFARQIFVHKRIMDYSEANALLPLIQATQGGWKELWSQWGPCIEQELNDLKRLPQATLLQSKFDFWLAGARSAQRYRVQMERPALPSWLSVSESDWLGAVVVTAHGVDSVDLDLVHVSAPQSLSPSDERIFGACGIVLENQRLVAYSIPESEPVADVAAWGMCGGIVIATEYLDGILCMLYFAAGKWRISSPSEPLGTAPTSVVGGPSVAELFWRLFGDWRLPHDRSVCYTFVAVARASRCIVRYDKDALYLVGATRLDPYEDLLPWRVADSLQWQCAPIVKDVRTRQAAVALMQSWTNPFEKAGLVCWDVSIGRRFALYTAEYCSVVATRNGSNFGYGPFGNLEAEHLEDCDFAAMVLRNEASTFALRWNQKWGAHIEKARRQLKEKLTDGHACWEKLMEGNPDKKTFALRAKSIPHSAIFFDLYNHRVSSILEALMLHPNAAEILFNTRTL